MEFAFVAKNELYSYQDKDKRIKKMSFDGKVSKVFTDMATGHQVIFIIDSLGDTWSRGKRGNSLILGRGPDVVKPYIFERVHVDVQFKKIACGKFYSAAIDIYDEMWICGGDKSGLFVHVGPVKFVDVSAGEDIVVAIDKNGSVWSCGLPHVRSPDGKFATAQLTLICEGNFQAVACGYRHTLCLDSNGNVWGVGSNNNLQLGLQEKKFVPTLTLISIGAPVIFVSAGWTKSLFLLENRELFTTGYPPEDYSQITINNNKIFEQVTAIGKAAVVKDFDGNLWIVDDNITFVPGDASIILPNTPAIARYNTTKSARKIAQ